MEEKATYAVPGDVQRRLTALNDVYTTLLHQEQSYLLSVTIRSLPAEVHALWKVYIAQQRRYETVVQWFFDHNVVLWFDRDTLEYYVAKPADEG